MNAVANDVPLAKSIDQNEAEGIWRVSWAAFIGCLVEWYDYYIYGTAAALVFSSLFFPNVDPAIGLIASFATFGVGFAARPIGGIVFGHFGDRIGRKKVLVLTLILMGVSTVCIGLLPTYSSIGMAAPVLLVALRLVQGFAVGGEFGGAASLVVEYAPPRRRGFFGALTQTGNVAGLTLGTGSFTLLSLLPDEQFESWGWRVPFLASIVLIVIGLFIRARIGETPAFKRLQERKEVQQAKLPLAVLFRDYWRTIILACGSAATMFSASYIAITYIVAYADGSGKISDSAVLGGVTFAAALSIITWTAGGALTDRFGRRPVMMFGAVLCFIMAAPIFMAVDTGSVALTWLAIFALYGVACGALAPVLPTFFAELFETRVRYTGISIGYQLPAVLVGGFTPMISAALVARADGAFWPVSIYLSVIAVFSLVCLVFVREPRLADLDEAATDASIRHSRQAQRAPA